MTIDQPDGWVFKTDKGKAELKWNPQFSSKWNEKYEEAQIWLDEKILDDCEPFVPFRTGMLVLSGQLGTVAGDGIVQWQIPYAKYQYYGKVMVGIPRRVTDRDLVYHGGGSRGSFWFERAKELWLDDWVKGVEERIGSK